VYGVSDSAGKTRVFSDSGVLLANGAAKPHQNASMRIYRWRNWAPKRLRVRRDEGKKGHLFSREVFLKKLGVFA
jgi:hypothetical protein